VIIRATIMINFKSKIAQKLYCYVDETGQDTKGRLFLVSVVITEKQREELHDFLLKIEKETGKNLLKWNKSSFNIRKNYLLEVFNSRFLRRSVFFSRYEIKAYIDLTILTVAKAILQRAKKDYKATIFVDGLNKKGIRQFSVGLRKLKIHVRKIRGTRDESEPLIRLADAIAGFLRDYIEGQSYAKKFYRQISKKKIIEEI